MDVLNLSFSMRVNPGETTTSAVRSPASSPKVSPNDCDCREGEVGGIADRVGIVSRADFVTMKSATPICQFQVIFIDRIFAIHVIMREILDV